VNPPPAGPETPDPKRLKAAVDAAVLATRTPPEPGATSWPFTIPQQHFSPADWKLLWDVVRYVRRRHNALFRKFLYSQTIADLVVDHLAELRTSPTLDAIVRHLRTESKKTSAWLVEVPVHHLQLPREIVPIAKRGLLVASDQRRDLLRTGPHLKDTFGVRRYMGDDMSLSGRWQQAFGSREDVIDRGILSSFLIAEDGTEEVAVALARTRARLALAMWCLLKPPRFVPNRWRPVWPSVTDWSPGPFLLYGTHRKPYGEGSVRGRSITEFGPYQLTRSEAFISAPFKAMEAAHKGNDAALAVLSAARSLYLAGRLPSDLEQTERLVHVWQAKEALSHQGHKGLFDAATRWDRLFVNLRLRAMLTRRGYSNEEIGRSFEVSESLRDLTTHFPEDVLVNLNYPAQRKVSLRRNRVLDAELLGLAAVAEDLPPMYAAVREAARRLAVGAIRNNWSERWWHSKFS